MNIRLIKKEDEYGFKNCIAININELVVPKLRNSVRKYLLIKLLDTITPRPN